MSNEVKVGQRRRTYGVAFVVAERGSGERDGQWRCRWEDDGSEGWRSTSYLAGVELVSDAPVPAAKPAESKPEAPKPLMCTDCNESPGTWRDYKTMRLLTCDPCHLGREAAVAADMDEYHRSEQAKPPAMGPLPARYPVMGWNLRYPR